MKRASGTDFRASGIFGCHGPCPKKHTDFDVTQPRLWRREYRPYFENYTVDASILDIPSKHSRPCDGSVETGIT
jgi:hypothetical protein